MKKTLKIPFKRFVVIWSTLKNKWNISIYTLFPLALCLLTYNWAFNICLWSIILDSIEDLAGNMRSLRKKWNEVRRKKKNPKLMGDDLSFLSVNVFLCDGVCLCVGLKIHNTEILTFLYYLKCLETFRKFQFWKFIPI